MRVGYVSNLMIGEDTLGIRGKVWKEYYLETESVKYNLDALVIAGGISSQFDITCDFMKFLGDTLKKKGILLRFIAGNTDYYDSHVGVDKEESFRKKKEQFLLHPYYLTSHPIIRSDIVISGIESWYDYSLYRGEPIQLKKIMKKKKMGQKNLDGVYITNESDYTLGFDNVFDVVYTKECVSLLEDRMRQINNKFGKVKYNVVVQYFYPSKIFLSDNTGLFNTQGYFDAFSGSEKFLAPMRYGGVTDCIIGKSSERERIRVHNINFQCCTNRMVVKEYDV